MADDYNTLVDSMRTQRSGSKFDSTSPDEFNAGRYASYEYAADNHNYGNDNFAFTDPSTWGEGLSSAGKFIVSAAASGLNSFYNTGVTVGNWLGADLKENDISVQLAALDSDLGKYYQENRESADLVGFVATSLIPGLGGVKLLNAGQKSLKAAASSGAVGTNISRATGLLVPEVNMYRKLAAAEIATSQATAALTSANTLKAIGAGYGQAALEAAAFETAVAATMFKSPVLEDADGWDIAKNIALGTVLGGAIGGAITHATTFGAIKKEVTALNPAEKLFTDTADIAHLTPSQRIIVRQERLNTMPIAPSAAEIASGEFLPTAGLLKDMPARDIVGVSEDLSTKYSRMRTETVGKLNNSMREDFHTIAGGDKDIGNALADMHSSMSSYDSFGAMTHLNSTGRMSSVLKEEVELGKYEKAISKLGADDVVPDAPFKISYLKLSGEGAGDVSFEAPKLLSIADKARNSDEVLTAVKNFRFSESKVFNPLAKVSADSHTALEARYLWADRFAELKSGARIHEHDIPLLERAIADKLDNITVVTDAGDYTLRGADDIYNHTIAAKSAVADTLMHSKSGAYAPTVEEIAKITNQTVKSLEGEIDLNSYKNLFARQDAKANYAKYLEDNNIPYASQKLDEFGMHPTYAKLAHNTKAIEADGHLLAGMAYIKAEQKAYQQAVNNTIANQLPEDLFNQLWHPTDDVMLSANRYGAGPGIATFANGGYNTAASWAESIGSATSRIQKHFKNTTSETLQAPLHKLLSNPEAAIEFESVNAKLMATSELYGFNAAGRLEPIKMLDYKEAIAAGKKVAVPTLMEGTELEIAFSTREAADAWKARTSLTGNRTTAFADIRNAQGLEDIKDARALRPVRQDPKEFPHFALVVDEKVTGVGHKSMIHAASEKELEAMVSKVPSNYKVYKKGEMEAFQKAHGEFDFERTLHENYIDSDLKRNGVNNPFFVRTDPQLIAKSVLDDHLRSDDIFTRELVNAKYEKEFSFLRQQGEQFTATATSRYTGSFKSIENTIKNPYTNYMKTALNISQVNEYPLIAGLNTKLDAVVSAWWRTVENAFSAAKTPKDLEAVTDALEKFGVKHAYRDAATDLLANHTAPKGDLSRFVRSANSIVSSLVTRLDPLNAINNIVGSTVLYGTEVKSVLSSLKGDSDAMGKLSGLLKSTAPLTENITPGMVPTGDTVLSAGKLLQNAVKNFHSKDAVTITGKPLKEYYQANGWSSRLHDQFQTMLDDLTLGGAEIPKELDSKLAKAFNSAKVLTEKGEKYTGNKLAEEFNRFVAADTMRQITDIGVAAGKITEQEALGYINSFVNRTQGNILASQRPLMFQGPVGQAIGLFQTFQFNTMQQLFRHVAEGSKKDAAMLLGLQSTMYGMNGLPAFNFLNTHIVGSLSGNPQHQDAYSATYGAAGKSIGDMILYGVPSNLLRGNLYTRGDINPRHLTVVPSNPADIPFISATAKMYSNVRNMVATMGDGGNMWQSLLQGIEHNGLSRPLAGVSQVAQSITSGGTVFSTNLKGNISGTNDLFSWATAVRLAGGKPFDEAVANDAAFRVAAYTAKDRLKMDALSRAIKTTTIGNEMPSGDEVADFAAKYAALGGKQENFNKYLMLQFKTSNTSKANDLAESLKNPYSQKMQQIMGGRDYFDGRDIGF